MACQNPSFQPFPSARRLLLGPPSFEPFSIKDKVLFPRKINLKTIYLWFGRILGLFVDLLVELFKGFNIFHIFDIVFVLIIIDKGPIVLGKDNFRKDPISQKLEDILA